MMIHRLSESIAYFCGEKVGYSDDKIEVCIYGLELILSDLIVFSIAMLVSVITNMFIYTVLLLGTFILLRHQLGGFHASSHLKCNTIFFIAYILALAAIKYTPVYSVKYVIVIIGFLNELIALKYAPVEHPNRPVSKRKKAIFKKTGIVLITLFWIIALILSVVFLGLERYALSIILGMFYSGVSIVSEFYRQYYKNLLRNK